jgi:ABC-type uncharacterized transport system permease subunit
MDSVFLLLLFATVRLSLPLFFACIGGYFSEKAGVAQIALEAYLLVGAFSAAGVTYLTGSISTGYLAGAVSAMLFSQIFCLMTLQFRTNSIVAGTALNLLAMGLIPIVSKTLFSSTGSTPPISLTEGSALLLYAPYIVLFFTVGISYWLSEKSLWGLQIKFAGEKKLALESVGISPQLRQWQSLSLSAFVTGLGGAVLSTYLASSYSPMMSAGRGFIALAALIFAGWNLQRGLIICLFFGFCEALQIQLQSSEVLSRYIALEFIQTLPYAATLFALLMMKSKLKPPVELR